MNIAFPRVSTALTLGPALLLTPILASGLLAADNDESSLSLDELLQIEPETEPDAPDAPGAADGSADEADPAADGQAADPRDSDGAAAVSEAMEMDEAADVFEQAVVQMNGVSRRLGELRDPGLVTQREQREIIKKLEQVIASAKQQQGKGGKSKPSSGEPQQQSRKIAEQRASGSSSPSRSTQSHSGQFSPGAAQAAQEGGDIEELRREWGNLPPRLRNELSEGLSEPFSPVYRELTESFYRRLGEEQE